MADQPPPDSTRRPGESRYVTIPTFVRGVLREWPDRTVRAWLELLLLAGHQPERGYFESRELVRAYLGRRLAREFGRLVELGALIQESGGRWYLNGWKELHENARTVPMAERLAAAERALVMGSRPLSDAERQARSRARRLGIGVSEMGPRDSHGKRHDPQYQADNQDQAQANGKGRDLDPNVRYLGNVFKAFEQLKRRPPSPGETSVLEEMARQYGREHVAGAMYAEPNPTAPSFLGRVGRRIRGHPDVPPDLAGPAASPTGATVTVPSGAT